MSNKRRNPSEVQENDDLLEFIMDKTENVKSPMNLEKLSKDYMTRDQSMMSENYWKRRIQRLCSEIQKNKSIEVETKVKILFALSASVDFGFQVELNKRAFLKLDDFHRIIKYKTKDGLQLEGNHNDKAVEVMNSLKRRSSKIDISNNHNSQTSSKTGEDSGRQPLENTPNMQKMKTYYIESSTESEEDNSKRSKRSRDHLQTLSSQVLKVPEYLRKHEIFIENKVAATCRKQDPLDNDSESSDNSDDDEVNLRDYLFGDELYGIHSKNDATPLPHKKDHSSESLHSPIVNSTPSYTENDSIGRENSKKRLRNDIEISTLLKSTSTMYVVTDESTNFQSHQTTIEEYTIESSDNDIEFLKEIQVENSFLDKFTSLKDFLLSFRGPVNSLENSMLDSIRRRINFKIKMLRIKEKKISIETIARFLNTFLDNLPDNSEQLPLLTEESADLKEFYYMLKPSVCFIQHPLISQVKRELDRRIDDLSFQNKNIPIETIKTALKKSLGILGC